jgi:dTDP-glucose 4,6-dehydratase
LVDSWHETYGFPAVVTHSTNNYGPGQYPEKLIPLVIATALSGLQIPIYGDGGQVRDWIHVEDHVSALRSISDLGVPGEHYEIAGRNPVSNLDLVRRICALLDEVSPSDSGKPYADQISHVDDRPAHDRRYAIDDSKTRNEIGWAPAIEFDDGLFETIVWFVANGDWWQTDEGDFLYQRPGVLK